MAAISDTRGTILEIVNEVRRRLGIPNAATLASDTQAGVMVDLLNDVINYVSDYGDWQEQRQEVIATASTSVFSYLVSTASPLKNIADVYFGTNQSRLRYVEIEDMRRFRQSGGTGTPRQWTINGVDNTTTGNPLLEVYPQPGTNENNTTFNILVYVKPPLYTTSDDSTIPPFPSRMLVQMLLALALLDESRGTANIDYRTELQRFDLTIEEALNRYNYDSAGDPRFVPTRWNRRI